MELDQVMPAAATPILLVEDDHVDEMAVRRALRQLEVNTVVHVARNGKEALDMMRGESGRGKLPRPYIVALDLNMPVMNGHEFLRAVREDDELKSSVIFVLTISSDDDDRNSAYEHNVAGYILKTGSRVDVLKAMKMLTCYSNVVKLPN